MSVKVPSYAEYVLSYTLRKKLIATYREVYSDSLATKEYDDGKISEDEWLATCAELDEGDPPDARCFPHIAELLDFMKDSAAIHAQCVALRDKVKTSNDADPTPIKSSLAQYASNVVTAVECTLIKLYV